MADAYLHGYDHHEQRRLIRQAEYWRDMLILRDLPYQAGQSLLDIGCGCGAVLGVLNSAHPALRLAGIDLQAAQIDFARKHLSHLGAQDADLRVGDASRLPWPDHSFNHVYMMWFLEHLADPLPVLAEARRVLKPGGTITINETEYTTFKVWPLSEDWDHLEAAQLEHFSRHGTAHIGRRLGALLHQAGFAHVCNAPVGFHFFHAADLEPLRRHCEYVADFLEPAIPALAALGFDARRLARGIAHLRSLPNTPGSSFTTIVYRARAEKP